MVGMMDDGFPHKEGWLKQREYCEAEAQSVLVARNVSCCLSILREFPQFQIALMDGVVCWMESALRASRSNHNITNTNRMTKGRGSGFIEAQNISLKTTGNTRA